MDRGAWWATVHGVTKGQIQLSMHAYTMSFINTQGGRLILLEKVKCIIGDGL